MADSAAPAPARVHAAEVRIHVGRADRDAHGVTIAIGGIIPGLGERGSREHGEVSISIQRSVLVLACAGAGESGTAKTDAGPRSSSWTSSSTRRPTSGPWTRTA